MFFQVFTVPFRSFLLNILFSIALIWRLLLYWAELSNPDAVTSFVAVSLIDSLYAALLSIILFFGWHVYFSFRLFQEKTQQMRWNDESTSTEESGLLAPSSPTPDPSSDVTIQVTKDVAPSNWYADHMWMARPQFMLTIIAGAFFLFLSMFVAVGIATTYNADALALIFQIEIGILVIGLLVLVPLLIFKYRLIREMRDGKNSQHLL